MLGFLTHLILDEMYSVDVMDTRIKASFGTALKLIDTRHLGASLGMAAATVLVVLLAPPTKTFVDGVGSKSLWSGLQQRLLPDDKWFGLIDIRHFAKSAEQSENGITTGSISRAPAADVAQESAPVK